MALMNILPILQQETPVVEAVGNLKPTCIICDIDGVLAMMKHPGKKFDFEDIPFCTRVMSSNKADWRLISLINLLCAKGIVIVLATGRPDRYRKVTQDWLSEHKVKYEYLHMRRNGSNKSDADEKLGMLRIIERSYHVWFAIEDRNSVVAMWRQQGLLCLQPREGNF